MLAALALDLTLLAVERDFPEGGPLLAQVIGLFSKASPDPKWDGDWVLCWTAGTTCVSQAHVLSSLL